MERFSRSWTIRSEVTGSIAPSQVRVLLVTAMLSSAAGLVLELLLVTQASYLAGNATLATGVVVGTFLAAMGLGAWITEFLAVSSSPRSALLRCLLLVELSLCPLCLLGPLALFQLFAIDGPLWLAVVVLTILVGVLGGMELPLITRLLETQQQLRQVLARVLALDYFGSLLGALAFPMLLLPTLGLLPTAAVLSIVPIGCACWLSWTFSDLRKWRRGTLLAMPIIAAGGLVSVPLGDRIEDNLYSDPVISRVQSRYQRIVLTRRRGDMRLYLDGNLQFSSRDEYRYHEALVHPGMAAHPNPKRILLLGAGDGLALREVLRWPDVERVDLIELDPEMLRLAQKNPALQRLNQNSFADPRVHVEIGDAFGLLRTIQGPFDVVIADFPDPDTASVARLYSVGFYSRLIPLLSTDGIFITQASTPFFTPMVLASIEKSLQHLPVKTHPYSVTVPSFGPWGFVLAHREKQTLDFQPVPFEARWFDQYQLKQLMQFPKDYRPEDQDSVKPNRLSRPVLIDYQRRDRWSAPIR